MKDPNPTEFLEDLLSPITRAERRNLLIASTAGYLVAKAGLIPTQISALGITLTPPAQGEVVKIVAFTITYFLLAFAIYGTADFFIWRKKLQDYLEYVFNYRQSLNEGHDLYFDDLYKEVPPITWLYRKAKHLAFVRVVFDGGLPIVFGLYAIRIVLK